MACRQVIVVCLRDKGEYEMCYMTEKHRDDLLEHRRELGLRLAQIRLERARVCRFRSPSDRNGGSIGDHYVHDHEEEQHIARIGQIDETLSSFKVAPHPNDRSVARINHVLVIREADRPQAAALAIHVVGHEEGDVTTSPIKVAYTAPLIREALGCVKGDTFEALTPVRKKVFEILDIRMPQEVPVLVVAAAA